MLFNKNELFNKGNSLFFLKGGCTCTCGTPPGYGLEDTIITAKHYDKTKILISRLPSLSSSGTNQMNCTTNYFTPIFWWVCPWVISSRRNQHWVSNDGWFLTYKFLSITYTYVLTCVIPPPQPTLVPTHCQCGSNEHRLDCLPLIS